MIYHYVIGSLATQRNHRHTAIRSGTMRGVRSTRLMEDFSMKQPSDTGSAITRRSVVSGSAMLLAEGLAGAQSLAKPTRLVDVHHHHMPPRLIEVMKMNLIAGASNPPP